MILQAFKTAVLIMCAYIGYIAYQRMNQVGGAWGEPTIPVHRQVLTLSNLWNDQQFEQPGNTHPSATFSISQAEKRLSVNLESTRLDIPLASLNFDLEDARHIDQVLVLSPSPTVLLLKSKYFALVHHYASHSTLYSRVGLVQMEQTFSLAEQRDRLWVFTHPGNNVLLLRVYDMAGGLLHVWKQATLEKIQSLREVHQVGREVHLRALAFSRNYVLYTFSSIDYQLVGVRVEEATSFHYYIDKLTQFETQLNKKVTDSKIYLVLSDLVYRFSLGRAGTQHNSTALPEPEGDDEDFSFSFQALDVDKSLILQMSRSLNQTTVLSFDTALLPFRSPVFVNKKQMPQTALDELIQISHEKDKDLKKYDFKVYGIKSQNLQWIRNKNGIYRLLPDSKLHFLTFDPKFISFYPKENLNQQEYHHIRTAKGFITFKGMQLKGYYDQLPLADPTPSINYGDSVEVTSQLSTGGNEVMPGIYEAHVIYNSLIVSKKKKSLELFSCASVKAIVTHYLSSKEGYELSGSLVQNNQWWVFEHNVGTQPLITKYQLFVNASAPKNVLAIRRAYTLDIIGRVTRLQKCIDNYYYITYVTDQGRLGMSRLHHSLLNNRQSLADGKYSGVFERSMVLSKIPRDPNFRISEAEEHEMSVTLSGIEAQVVQNWKQLELKHQFRVLPIRVFAYENTYYVVNLRKTMQDAFRMELQAVQTRVVRYVVLSCAGLGGLALLLVLAGLGRTENRRADAADPAKPKDKKQQKPGKKNKRQ